MPLREQVRSYLFADDFGGGVVRDNKDVSANVAQGIGGVVAAILSDEMARATGRLLIFRAGSCSSDKGVASVTQPFKQAALLGLTRLPKE